ncbi:MAG: hypothetical protein EOP46_07630 [Sphingobacteriaceae bacterium]|nr:MAG: hypothetical protein EOP46_07630 [Sphingobacteriaceae bacterium]
MPFIKQRFKAAIISYSVYLSTLQGDHLVISFNISVNPEEFTNQFNTFIGNFIARYPSKTLPPAYPLDSLFMDYPNNRLYFGIEKKLVLPPGAIQYGITSAIISGLAVNDMDEGARFTFILYMQLAVIKAKYNDMNDACNAIAQISEYVLAHNPGTAPTAALPQQYAEIQQQLYDSNNNILQEIITDIWNTENYSPELLWLEDWISVCRELTKAHDIIQPFLTISRSIFEQMGLSDTHLQYLLLNIYYKSFKTNLNTFYYE